MAQADRPSTRTENVSHIVPNPFFSAVSDSEGDMRRVFDLALIIHDYMSDGQYPIDAEHQDALSHITSDLVETGRRLREKCDALYAAARR